MGCPFITSTSQSLLMNSEDVLATAPRLISYAIGKGKEYKRRKTIFPRFKIDPRSFLQVFSYINHFLPIYYSLYSYNRYHFFSFLYSVKIKPNMAISVVLDSVQFISQVILKEIDGRTIAISVLDVCVTLQDYCNIRVTTLRDM